MELVDRPRDAAGEAAENGPPGQGRRNGPVSPVTPLSPPTPAPLFDEAAPGGQAPPPLNVTGLVVTKADLVTALRIYHPLVVDLAPLDGGRYLLSFVPPA